MVLNIDGSRNRRLGMNLEDSYEIVDTTINWFSTVAVSTFKWDNAGGDPQKSLLVVQIGRQIKIFDMDNTAISGGLIGTANYPSSDLTDKFSYAVVDGILIIATGQKDIYPIQFQAPNTLNYLSPRRLLIRDFFGVEDTLGGVDFTFSTNVQDRPFSLTSNHTYNLRNQSWGVPRLRNSEETLEDPIETFRSAASGRFPANSDTVIEALYPDAQDSENRTVDRFFAGDLFNNPLGTARAPLGYFIIDALDRGASRIAEDAKNVARYPELEHFVTTLPVDSTVGGATAIAEFAGRVFYSGFSGELVGGDKHSPKMSSYVLFSKVVDSSADITVCYQEGDPTSKNSPDIIATDGGFIRINEAYGIKKLINLGSSLMVVASNGIWRIVGGTDNGFTATSYIVDKITDRGCDSAESVVVIDNSFMFWGTDGIYHVATDQFGGWVCNNITFGRIQKFFDNITDTNRAFVKGEYDSNERKVHWIYNNRTNLIETHELILDIQLQAFYIFKIGKFADANYPKVVGLFKGNPYLVNGDSESFRREVGYLVITSISPRISYSFAKYNDLDFRDWSYVDGIGLDAEAFMVTSYMSGDDFQRDKQIPYITIHSRRTETGFDADLNPINQSSCLCQVRWDWSNTSSSGKWGREFQAYRYRRLYIPQNSSDDYDNGFSTIVTRNKLRGNGKVLTLRFRTEPYRNMHLYGWSMILSVAENV